MPKLSYLHGHPEVSCGFVCSSFLKLISKFVSLSRNYIKDINNFLSVELQIFLAVQSKLQSSNMFNISREIVLFYPLVTKQR